MLAPSQNSSMRPGIGWQRWTPAALPLLARHAHFTFTPPPTASTAQRRLVEETLRSLRAVHRLCRASRWLDRAGELSARWATAISARIELLERAVARLSQGGVWLWWRQSGGLELQCMRMRR
jgi:hypothetical protein